MTDIRRTLLWVVFSMSLVLLWDGWNKHNGHPSMFSPAPARPSAASAPAGASSVPAPSAATPTTGSAPAAPVAPQAASPAPQVVVDTDVVRATFDARGGNLARLELLRYAEESDPSRHVVLFDESAARTYEAQSGLIATSGTLPNHLTVMQALPGERKLQAGRDAITVAFESPEVGGVRLKKTWTLHRGQYTIDAAFEVANVGTAPVTPQLYLQLVRDGNAPPGGSSFYSTFTGPAVYTEAEKFKKIDFKHIEKNEVEIEKHADNGWIAMVQHYFTSAWLLPPGTPREFRTAKVAENLYSIAMVETLPQVAPGAATEVHARLYAGPQEEYRLEQIAPGLELVKDYGWFTILAKPLFGLLTHLHQLIGNWGWAIVGLVVLLKVAFYWLNASAYRSMAKMKAINPKVMEMRERLKDKPQQMQQEMMRIYREEKVNPLGGCLPILVQMPFFIALYWVLLSSVEMRNAPWIGWIHDLSARDPYFILPLLMTASTMLQTWLNPTPPDPVQARMMWIMPLVFSVMFFFFPAGLVLYWLTNNILSIAQQYLINKRLGVAGK
jgi:YidC/Oxa1 family membrane protein insertase